MPKNFSRETCRRCGLSISINGLAQYQHNEWHKRNPVIDPLATRAAAKRIVKRLKDKREGR